MCACVCLCADAFWGERQRFLGVGSVDAPVPAWLWGPRDVRKPSRGGRITANFSLFTFFVSVLLLFPAFRHISAIKQVCRSLQSAAKLQPPFARHPTGLILNFPLPLFLKIEASLLFALTLSRCYFLYPISLFALLRLYSGTVLTVCVSLCVCVCISISLFLSLSSSSARVPYRPVHKQRENRRSRGPACPVCKFVHAAHSTLLLQTTMK